MLQLRRCCPLLACCGVRSTGVVDAGCVVPGGLCRATHCEHQAEGSSCCCPASLASAVAGFCHAGRTWLGAVLTVNADAAALVMACRSFGGYVLAQNATRMLSCLTSRGRDCCRRYTVPISLECP